MAEPARRSPAGLGAPGWGDVRREMVASARFVASAVAAYLADGGDAEDLKADMAGLAIDLLREACETARHIDTGEAALDIMVERAVAEVLGTQPRHRHLRAL